SPYRDEALRAGDIREEQAWDKAEAKRLKQYEELSANVQNSFNAAGMENPQAFDYLMDQENREEAEFLGSALPARGLRDQLVQPNLRQTGSDTVVPTHSIEENAPWARQPDPAVLRHYPVAKEWM